MTGIFLGFGSNLGDRRENLHKAVKGLESRGVSIRRASSVYETAPIGFEEQPDFLNAVVEVKTSATPEELFDICREVEISLGRVGRERWGPRVIDVDLLLYEDIIKKSDALVLPHPRLVERLFVLAPLLEIAPDLKLPDNGRLDGYLEGVSDQAVVKVGKLAEK
ncbi:MAG: 2-amino-4-hydroxy-6-hydroxymethyldihydropteridine diphosphokinase [Actinobacteria bacterium]|nr:2-amino-4-hydroxy-6-hydroxymethyldihydropteridine diphosphokinase [Actinomycetota bacterium]